MTGGQDPGRPWWASQGVGGPGEGHLDGEDPFEAHRRARAGGTDGEDTTGHGPGAGRDDAGHAGAPPWWTDAVDLLVRLARDATRPGAGGHAHAGRTPGHDHGVEACQLCPVCTLIRVLGEARPELVTHLSEAARHLTLAAKAVVDAQAEGWRRDDGLQRIDLDEE